MAGELYKIAIGDSDLINVRFGPLKSDISRGPRMGWTGRAPAPNDSQSAWGACQEKEEHPHASRIHRSRSDRDWNRSRQEHTSYDRSRFVWRHRAAREGLARTHRIEACEPATLPHWHRSRNGDTLCYS